MNNGDKAEEIYAWVDQIPLSRQKKNISRDFSDGVLMAEIVKHFYPKMVDLHNYCSASSKALKVNNWSLLNRKVLGKLDMRVPPDAIGRLVDATPGAVEVVLEDLRERVRLDQDDGSSSNMRMQPNFADETDGGVQARSMISSKALSKLRRDMEEKDEAIGILTDKVCVPVQKQVSHLENLLALKSQRIKDLSAQLLRYQGDPPAEGRRIGRARAQY